MPCSTGASSLEAAAALPDHVPLLFFHIDFLPAIGTSSFASFLAVSIDGTWEACKVALWLVIGGFTSKQENVEQFIFVKAPTAFERKTLLSWIRLY